MPNYNPPKENFFSTDRSESCTAQVTVRIPPSHKAELKEIDGWREEIRKLVQKMVEEKKKANKEASSTSSEAA